MSRPIRLLAPLIIAVAAVAAMLVGLALGGGAAAQLVADPGAMVRYGLPTAKLLLHLSAAVTIGALVLCCFALVPDRPEYVRSLDIAAVAAGVWTIAAGAHAFLTFLTIYLQPVSLDDRFGQTLARYLTTTELGQAGLQATVAAAVVTVLCFAVRSQTLLVPVAALAVLALVPIAAQGHASAEADHDAAVSALWIHVAAAGAWLGGLLVITLSRDVLGRDRLGPVLARYSSVALVCFVVVAASGYVGAEIRVGSADRLLSPYGILIMVKVLALLVLGILGAAQRRFLIERVRSTGARRPFWWFVSAELALMGVASGAAAALARTAPPAEETVAVGEPTPAEVLTGSALPPPPTWDRYFTTWDLDLMWLLVCGFGTFFYLAGVWRLRHRGDSWPVHRTVLWVCGMLLLFYVTNGGVNAYEEYLFSAHMLGHMLLTMAIPVLLVPGAPVTLVSRAVRKRGDGSRGAREWILLAVHSRAASVLANPVVAAVIFAGSLWAFYFTPLFRWATVDHVGHQWMIVHFLAGGYLFVQALIGVDPVPYRAPYPLRLLLLLATMAFHAFFGLAIMSNEALLLADWYGAMGWGTDALIDQRAGGGIAWSVGEIPTAALAIAVAVMWSRSDAKEGRRKDRQAERDGDAELSAYNAMLARRSQNTP